MRFLLLVVAWLVLLAVSWPLALLVLVLTPVLLVLSIPFLLLGLTSFGGPIAHLGYFREAFVVRRRWLSEAAYADLVEGLAG